MSQSEGAPDLPYPKLPFWDAVSLAYSSYFQHFVDALRASWLWLIVVAALTAVASWWQWSWMATAIANMKPGAPPQLPSSEMHVLLNLDNVLLLLAGVSIAVAWHRLMILHERPGLSGGNVATKNLWRYVAVGLALILIIFLPALAVMVPAFSLLLPRTPGAPPPSGFFLLIPVIFVIYAVGLASALRLTLLLPAQAIGDSGLTFRQTWNRTRGNTWRLFWGVVLTTAPPLLIAQIVFVLGIGPPRPNLIEGEDFAARMTAASTVGVIYYLLIVPIGIGFLSHAYRHFFQAPLELAE
jgi:hypothetical protein